MSADERGESLALVPPGAVDDDTVAVSQAALAQHGHQGAVPSGVPGGGEEGGGGQEGGEDDLPGDCESEVARQEGSPDDAPIRNSQVVHYTPRDRLRGGGGQAQDRLHTQLLPDYLGQPEVGLRVWDSIDSVTVT